MFRTPWPAAGRCRVEEMTHAAIAVLRSPSKLPAAGEERLQPGPRFRARVGKKHMEQQPPAWLREILTHGACTGWVMARKSYLGPRTSTATSPQFFHLVLQTCEAWYFSVAGTVLCGVLRTVSGSIPGLNPLHSSHMPLSDHYTNSDDRKYLWARPNAPWGIKSPLFEKQCPFGSWQSDCMTRRTELDKESGDVSSSFHIALAN